MSNLVDKLRGMTLEQRVLERNRLRRNALETEYADFVQWCLSRIEEDINARFPNALSSDSLQRMVGGRQAVTHLRVMLLNMEEELDSEPQENLNG